MWLCFERLNNRKEYWCSSSEAGRHCSPSTPRSTEMSKILSAYATSLNSRLARQITFVHSVKFWSQLNHFTYQLQCNDVVMYPDGHAAG